jgi:O-antigen/teichoic acid export membrane protein
MDSPEGIASEKVSAKIARNTLANAMGRFWSMAVAFFLTPYIVGKLGDERFGIWAFLGVFVGYFAVVDLGISPAVVKFVAQYYTSRDFERLNRAVNSAFVAVALLMGTLCLIGVSFSRPFLHLFKLSPQNYPEAWFALVGFFILMIGQGSLSVFQGVLSGLQRMDVMNVISIGTSLPSALSVILFIGYGYGLRGLIYANAITFALNLILTVASVQRVCPQCRFNPLMFDWKTMKELLSFGLQMQVNNLAALVCWHGDKIMIGFFLNMAKVTTYELGYRLAMTARMVPSFLFMGVMPAAAEVHAKEDHEQLQRMFDLGSRYLALFVFPSMSLLMLCAPVVMMAWMKESRPDSILAARMLSIGFLVNLLGGVGTSMARGMGRPDIETRTLPLQFAVNFGLGIPLIIKIGFWGPLIATPVSTILATVYVFYLLQTQLHLSLKSFLRHGVVAPALGSLFACAVTAVSGMTLPWSGATSRWVLLCYLALQGLVFIASYTFFIWRFRFPTGETGDWELVRSGLRLATSSLNGTLVKLGLIRGA